MNETYQQRYLISTAHWKEGQGPVFFYTGNEGDITWFCNNTVSTHMQHVRITLIYGWAWSIYYNGLIVATCIYIVHNSGCSLL